MRVRMTSVGACAPIPNKLKISSSFYILILFFLLLLMKIITKFICKKMSFQELYRVFVIETIRNSVNGSSMWGRRTLAPIWEFFELTRNEIDISIFQQEAFAVAKHMENSHMLTKNAETKWPLFLEMLQLSNCSNFRALELYEELKN